jgi:hypothetical protein
MKSVFWAAVLGVAIWGAVRDKDEPKAARWRGFYYPTTSDMNRVVRSPDFRSLDECRGWVRGVHDQWRAVHPNNVFDWECGTNCRFEHGSDICDETKQ